MKRLAIGCLVVFAVLFVAGGVIAYIFVWQPARQVVTTVRQFQQLGELDQQVEARGPYDAPEEGLLAEEQVERYLRVQQDMRVSLESEYEQLQARIEAIDAQQTPSPRELLQAYRDIADLIIDAKRAQVEALNRHAFSLSEYHWVRSRVLEALGLSGYATFDLQELLSSADDGEVPVQPSSVTAVPPPENVELVEQWEEEFDEVIGFALVGL